MTAPGEYFPCEIQNICHSFIPVGMFITIKVMEKDHASARVEKVLCMGSRVRQGGPGIA